MGHSQHHKRLADLMEKTGYGHILKKYSEPQDIQEWRTKASCSLGTNSSASTSTRLKEGFTARTELPFHLNKPVIYATELGRKQ